MFLSLPFYFRPVVKGKEESEKYLDYGKPSDNSKAAKKLRNVSSDGYLNTLIDYKSSSAGSYDSTKLNGYLCDEAAKRKSKATNIIEHFGQVGPTMLPGATPVGTIFMGSTVGKLDEGGNDYKELYEGSQVSGRNPETGRTQTALYAYFLPAQKNMDSFTDKYGVCYEEKPTKKIYNVFGDLIKMGSIDYLIAIEEQARKTSELLLNERYRTYPRTIDHAFRDETGSSTFNMVKLYDQIEYNEKLDNITVRGNFVWRDGVYDSVVEWHPSKDGRFNVAWLPSAADGTESMRNNISVKGDSKIPLNGDVIRFGCDPFSLASAHGSGSKGAIHGLTMPNVTGAPSNEFVVEYLTRPGDDTTFFEDIIKVCVYYGAPILIESNRIDACRHFKNRGYRKFVMDRVDKAKKDLNHNEVKYGGQMMSGASILDSHMNGIGSYIERNVGLSTNEQYRPLLDIGSMKFNETLKDWLKFDPTKRTKYDATISSGLAILACNAEKYAPKKTKGPKKVKLSDIMTKFKN